METEKSRIDYWDNLKGLLIVLVVLGHFFYDHVGNNTITMLGKTIFVFHMPLFIFISGYFSKNENVRRGERLVELFTFYLVGNTFFMVYEYFVLGMKVNLIEPYYSYWYILALIVWRASIKYFEKINWILPISIIIALFVGFFPNINNTFALCRILCFLPFFIMGYKLSEERALNIINNRNWKKYLIGFAITSYTLLITICFVNYASYDELKMFPYIDKIQFLYRIEIFILAVSFGIGLILLGTNKKTTIYY